MEPMRYLRFILKVSVWTFALVAFVSAGCIVRTAVAKINKDGHPADLIGVLMVYGAMCISFAFMVFEIHLSVRYIFYGQDEVLRAFSWFVALFTLVEAVFVIGVAVQEMHEKGHPRNLNDILIHYVPIILCLAIIIGDIYLIAVFTIYGEEELSIFLG